MHNDALRLLTLSLCGLALANHTFATNPLIMDQFTADPTARVFEGRIFVYPSHDIPPIPGKGRADWFCMEDYHAFSSVNLTDWKDHGVILDQTNVAWADVTSYSMWAPDCVFKNGNYYFYFPSVSKTGGRRIGVAVSDSPHGPFKAESKPIEGVHGIDPCVLVDRDGSAYLFYSSRKIFVAKLKDNMLELDSMPMVITNLPTVGLLEGPFVFERNGIYYLTYPHVENKTERLEYATSTNPLGPYKPAGVILDESSTGCWTVHQSIVEYRGQWFLFYHDKDLSPDFDKNRAIRADYLTFNEDGSIRKVTPTLRGVGIADAKSKLHIDRFSVISAQGTSVSFIDKTNSFEGWKTSFTGTNAWIQFDRVDFGRKDLKALNVRAVSPTGGLMDIRLDTADGTLLAQVEIGKTSEWKVIRSKLAIVPEGVHNLVVAQHGSSEVELDWISFE